MSNYKINRMIRNVSFAIVINFLCLTAVAQNHSSITFDSFENYKINLDSASKIYLAKSIIPDSILLNLVPSNYDEFEFYYSTTNPDNKLKDSGFFYLTSELIFKKYIDEKRENFYFPCIQLASFADGEYGEIFIDYLEKLIKMDSDKFCESVRDMDFLNHNPIKYYYNLNCKN